MRSTLALSLLVSASVAQAALTITNPTSSSWWVAKSANVLSWTCQDSPSNQFTVLINSPSMAAPLAIIAQENNFDCSKTITQDQANQAAGTGYTILLADPLNNTNVYATSEPFEIKALGSAYPSQVSSSASSGGSGTASGSGASASSTSTSSKSGAVGGGMRLVHIVAFMSFVVPCPDIGCDWKVM
ncbi:uncharacterized protein LACBIDRAFT_294613 [Laccaria bicolor S238N-H82]|uniref:Predicted protein n=1 Tax=Laccaria bicolor (strain S238N-H82 / ATCC MYA-4686) TaxID=486041 RepID=B0DFD3_LACBS|nr:uncharacterized protein LACBIDRAFT_294613 [Laccaria bicolor S238N-H82]EDR06683.1 predicted protein [Laccaria bicolor S238N-H82]|eukprot:XP_001882530.1 predicted protein [Laccaria bicolor S238N-H82]